MDPIGPAVEAAKSIGITDPVPILLFVGLGIVAAVAGALWLALRAAQGIIATIQEKRVVDAREGMQQLVGVLQATREATQQLSGHIERATAASIAAAEAVTSLTDSIGRLREDQNRQGERVGQLADRVSHLAERLPRGRA